MKLAIIVVCLLATSAIGAPKYKRPTTLDPKLAPQVSVAEQAWSKAEHETDPATQAALWEATAIAFGEVDGAPVDAKVKREAAYAAMLAWKNAIDVDVRVRPSTPARDIDTTTAQPLPARDSKLVAAMDRYVKYADAGDPEVPGLLYLEARTFFRYHQFDNAIPICRTIIADHRQHEVAEYAANLLLHAYNRQHKYDQLIALAEELAQDTAMMKRLPDLAAVVGRIRGQAKRKQVELLAAHAHAEHDLATFTAVGTSYLEMYTANPSDPDGDELLYNAGVAFESGAAIAAAIQAFTLVRRQYPRSKIAVRALARVGRLYGNIAQYDEAAEALELYARQYASEKDAYDAMSDAVFYRRALGQRDKAIANTEYFIKTFGATKPQEAASAMWSLTAIYEADPQREVAHLRAYLRSFGGKGGDARVVIAHAKIGQILWRRSCPRASYEGLCVTQKDVPRTCGRGNARSIAVTARDATTQREALAELEIAIKEFERNRVADDASARYYYAQAKLVVADALVERYLDVGFPANLTLERRERFDEWIDRKQKLGASATRAYEDLMTTKDAAGSITAASRIGLIAQSFATMLATAQLPRTGQDKVEAYCDVLGSVAKLLETRAGDAFTMCLAKSTELVWFGDSSAYCERELMQMMPEQFPRARELRGQASYVAPVIASEPPVRTE